MTLTIVCSANNRLDLHKEASAAVADFLAASGSLGMRRLTASTLWRLDDSPDVTVALPRDVADVLEATVPD